MAERNISQGFWNDPYIQNLNAKEKLLYIYLFSNEHDNYCGFYEITIKTIATETDLTIKDIQSGLSKFGADGKLIYENNLLFLVNMAKRQNATKLNNFKIHIEKVADKYSKYSNNAAYIQFILSFQNILDDKYNQSIINETNVITTDNTISTDKNDVFNEEKQGLDKGCGRVVEGLPNPLARINIQQTINNDNDIVVVKGGCGGEIGRNSPLEVKNKELDEQIIQELDKIELLEAEETAKPVKHKLQIWIEDNCPAVAKLKTQMTSEQCDMILQANRGSPQIVKQVLEQMENKADLTKKYKSVYLTLKNWIANQKEWNTKNGTGNYKHLAKGEVTEERIRNAANKYYGDT